MRISKMTALSVLVLALLALMSGNEAWGRDLKDKKTKRSDRVWWNPNQTDLSKPNAIVANQWAVHQKGLQWLMMGNFGELSNPDGRTAASTPFAPGSAQLAAELEYPGGTGTVFLFSGGFWVGAIKNGEKIVSTVTDGDNGTREFGPIMSWLGQSKDVAAKEIDDDGDWTAADDLNGDGLPSSDWDGPNADANGDGVFNYDPEPHIDEDPVGDISNDFQDNDNDGLIDGDDPDLDGDLVPGSRDDDGDGLEDEDTQARAGEEWITAYVDTCQNCLDSPDVDGFTPLGVRVVQHSYAWSESYADDFMIFDFLVTNIGTDVLQDVWLAMFFDFDIGHITQVGNTRSEDDITFFIDSLQTAVGGDADGDGGLLAAQYFGVRVLQTPRPDIQVSYLNFGRLAGADPEDNVAKYDLISSGARNPDQLTTEDWRFVLGFGPLGNLNPGQTLPVTLAIVNGLDLEKIAANSRQALAMFRADFRGPAAPVAPTFSLTPQDRAVKLTWDRKSEDSIDPISGTKDFEGYRIWRTLDGNNFTLVADFDLVNGIGFDRGLPALNANGQYEYVDTGVPPLVQTTYSITAYDNGDNGDGINHPELDRATGGVGELESSRGVERQQIVVANSVAKNALDDVWVVPNPYVGSSEFERFGRYASPGNVSFPKIIQFVNLPAQAKIQIFTLSGDLVQEIDHNDTQSGVAVWNLRTRLNQEAVAGIYLFRVAANGQEKIGKFLVVK